MLFIRILAILMIFVFSIVLDVESAEIGYSPTEEDPTSTEYNYPLLMIDIPNDFPDLPTSTAVIDGKKVLTHGSNNNTKYFCPTEDKTMNHLIEQNPRTEYFHKHNCLSETIFAEFSSILCNKKVRPFLKVYTIDGDQPLQCGKNDKGKLYAFAYLICLPGTKGLKLAVWDKIATNNVNMYELCFDHNRGITLYTQHRILSPSVLKTMNYVIDLATYQISKDPYDTFGDALVKMEQQIQENELVHHLSISPSDMAFSIWKKTLYHYSNVIGMPQKISSLWKFIDNQIRHAAIQSDSEYEIFMGEFTTEEKKFWCKLIFDEKYSRGATIIVQNDPNDDTMMLSSCSPCDLDKWNGSDNVKTELKLARCCKIKDNHFKLFGLMNEILKEEKLVKVFKNENHRNISANYLNLNDFINDQEKSPNTERSLPDEEDHTPDEYNYPLVMIDIPDDFPILPTSVAVTDGKRIFTYDSNSKIKYFCPDENETINYMTEPNPNTAYFNKHNCLSETIFMESSTKICKKKVHPFLKVYIIANNSNQPLKCGKNDKGQFYAFAYLVCLPWNRRLRATIHDNTIASASINMYEVCFDHKQGTILYTQHRIFSPSILKNINQISDLAVFKSNQISNYPYDTFGDAFVKLEEQIEENGFVHHLSISPEDMAFGTWKKTLYHYSNVIGMPQKISSLWKFIDNRIRWAAVQSDSEYEIFMGEFIAKGKKFWCKLIFDEKHSRGAAIIVLNDPKDETIIPYGCSLCDADKWDGSDKVKMELQLARCCKIKGYHFNFFGLINEIETKGKPAVKIFKNENHQKISANYLNLNDFTSDEQIPASNDKRTPDDGNIPPGNGQIPPSDEKITPEEKIPPSVHRMPTGLYYRDSKERSKEK